LNLNFLEIAALERPRAIKRAATRQVRGRRPTHAHTTLNDDPSIADWFPCDEILFDFDVRREAASPADRGSWAARNGSAYFRDQQTGARIHRKFDLMKQTQDHDGDVSADGCGLKSSKAAWFVA
jgi:hypothetical protein